MMFKVASLVAVVAACVYSASALTSNLLLCSGVELSGKCLTIPYTVNSTLCTNVPTDFNDIARSIAPEGDGHNCTLFADYNCSGSTLLVTECMDSFPSAFDNQTSSYRCSA